MSFFSSLFGGGNATKEQITTALDMVTSSASLVSNIQAVDSILETVRVITAKLEPGQAPTKEEDQRLLQVYLRLEQYLMTKEPLRAFTKDELRARFSPELLDQLHAYETAHAA